MTQHPDALPTPEPRAGTVTRAGLREVIRAYEDARVRGLCEDGALEIAFDLMRRRSAGDEHKQQTRPAPSPRTDA